MEAIILAGGFGTRLQHIISDVPKSMANVAGRPFLEYILLDIINKGINKIIIAVGYKKEFIIDYFGSSFNGCEIIYSEEDKPLLTGGAIKKALEHCINDKVFAINGDTYFDVDLAKMLNFAIEKNTVLVVAAKEMTNFDRYGTVVCEDNRIIAFKEKAPLEKGVINGGVYCLNRHLLDDIVWEKFSFENEILEKIFSQIPIYAFQSKGYFIDIGVEKDYIKAQTDFAKWRVYE